MKCHALLQRVFGRAGNGNCDRLVGLVVAEQQLHAYAQGNGQ